MPLKMPLNGHGFTPFLLAAKYLHCNVHNLWKRIEIAVNYFYCKPRIMPFQACNSWKVHKWRLQSSYVSYSRFKVIYYKYYIWTFWGEKRKFPFRGRVTVCIDAFVLQYKLQGWVANTFKWSYKSTSLLFIVLVIINFPNYLH